MNEMQKNIKKTVLVIVAIMVTILALFINKITTPRYLSNIELKINGLELIKTSQPNIIGEDASGEYWMLLAADKEDKAAMDALHQELKPSLRDKVIVVYNAATELKAQVNRPGKIIPIIKPSGEFLGYFTYPYDTHKMTLTLSSVLTHR
jgi:preprotein translocase subunit SecD